MHRLIASPEEASRKYLLYGADTPNTWKVATLLEELKLPYDVVAVDIMNDQQKAPEYVKLNPNGRTPTLVDFTTPSKPVAVFESGAIMLYLCEKHPSSLLPTADAALKSEAIQWLFWQVSALGPMMGQLMYMKRIAHGGAGVPIEKLAFSIERFQKECTRLFEILEARLQDGRQYLCGEGACGAYSVADIACWGYAAQHWWAGLDVAPYPSVRAWLARVGARPCIQQGLNVPGKSVLGEYARSGALERAGLPTASHPPLTVVHLSRVPSVRCDPTFKKGRRDVCAALHRRGTPSRARRERQGARCGPLWLEGPDRTQEGWRGRRRRWRAAATAAAAAAVCQPRPRGRCTLDGGTAVSQQAPARRGRWCGAGDGRAEAPCVTSC
jgi:GST-like protein